jgi:hypothetical protein
MMKFRKTYFNSANIEDVPPGPSDTFDWIWIKRTKMKYIKLLKLKNK